jgi:hypothetical protein
MTSKVNVHAIGTACLALSVLSAPLAGQAAQGDPDRAQLITSDIPRFWQAYDGATLVDASDRFQRLYIDAGTPGLQGFVPGRLVSGRHVAAAVAARPRYYASIRAATLAVDTASGIKERIRTSFRALSARYADAVFPDVYFVIGRLNSGGTTAPAGLLIGAEMYARSDDTPLDELSAWERSVITSHEALPHIVAHELIHYQQPAPQSARTLLAGALREGAADFVGELISGGLINTAQHAYGDAHEAELWAEFREAMHGTDVSRWMYQGDRAGDRPADLGYYMGYRIARAYYERAADKRAALREILRHEDPVRFLSESGYEAALAARRR